ncbi:transglycosylase SLT domain-containing protein [Pseudomonadales bacterium]|nr:transglycosylase SLT domain-containing protein [Pseudomonadales bacterium]
MLNSHLLKTPTNGIAASLVSRRFQQTKALISLIYQQLPNLAAVLVTTLLAITTYAEAAVTIAGVDKQTQKQREQYSQAKSMLQKPHLITSYKKLRQSLDDYPLAGHLDYLYHRQHINKFNLGDLEDFNATHNNSLLGNKLKRAWLQHLAKRKQWPRFVRHYDKALANSAMQCQYAWALYQTGEQARGLEAAKVLWMHSKSRPKSCDAIFHLLIKTDSIDSDLAWQRFILAFNARQHQLSKYLTRLLDGQQRKDANQLIKLYKHPQKIPSQWQTISLIPGQTVDLLESKYQLLKKLARSYPEKARAFALAIKQESKDNKDQTLAEKLIAYLIQSQAIKGYATVPEDYIALGSPQDASSLQWLLRAHIAQANWQGVIETIKQLPTELQEHERWRYWYYRAKSLSGRLTLLEEQEHYKAVANKASFYGFTTAENLGLPYGFEPVEHTPKPEHLELMRKNPYMQRASEHFAQQEYSLARSEWRRGSQSFNQEMQIDSAYFAQSLGWHHQAINTAAQAKAWQHYQLRFPNLYAEQFEQQAFAVKYSNHWPANWPYAIARQESAFASDAQSGAGAMGLMQILPSTAREVARKKNLKYQRSKLFNADYNIVLGSSYLKQLNKRYQHRALTSAAYNAGPRRANKWLKHMEQPLPIDAWIETIPFSETRQYVQNIFSFSLIHSLLYDDVRQTNTNTGTTADATVNTSVDTTIDKKRTPFIHHHEQMIYPDNVQPTIN